ncbi:hydantoinase/carbamoylase family amidase [Bacillus thermophilus]|uniref:Hydantoinase/carbamoylase family amidase n=1 Tax=Siminovitchia thermophila TaxID=1245522 RepID=A0ABS2R7T1_9BACI|nr:hydantoinase/carbamoylase family amidase [Siminovitchia thermophila]
MWFFTINGERLYSRIMELAKIGQIGKTGVRRLAHSPEDKEAVLLVKRWMEEIGLKTRIDHFGNLIGRLGGAHSDLPVLMVGSHIDTQPYAGRFDGTVGVLGALEALQTMIENNVVPVMSMEVGAFSDEEGNRFHKGLFGSSGILGLLEDGELDRQDKEGMTRRDALIEFGCDPGKFPECEYRHDQIHAFLELHIEQGPVLESKGEPIGIVSGISGPLWLTVELNGFAGDSGSVSMGIRQDALAGAAKIITALNDLASEDPETSTVGTVGSLRFFPNSRNIIPEKVSFTIDLRDIDEERRNAIETRLVEVIKESVKKHQLTYDISEDIRSEPRYCVDWIKQIMREESEDMGLNPPELMSGAFHDALAMSTVCDYGMIFVRSKDEVSHNPKEYSFPRRYFPWGRVIV